MAIKPALLCALEDSCPVSGEVIEDPDGCDTVTCPGTSGSMDLTTGEILCGGVAWEPTGFDPDKNYFRGQFPFGGPAGAYEFVVFCAGGVLKWALIDTGNCSVIEGNVQNWSCETLSGYFDVNVEQFFAAPDCCPDGPGANVQTFRVSINGGGP